MQKIKIGHLAKFRDKDKCFLQLLFPVRTILRFSFRCSARATFDSTPSSLSLQPLTAFAELSCGRRDFAKTEKGEVERVAEGEVGG